MNRKYIKRIGVDLFLVFALFFLPWWATLVLGVVFTFYLAFFPEVLLLGLLLDVLYGQGGHEIAFGYPITIFVSIIFVFSFWAKERLMFRQ
jgi:hypothetical protein